MRYSGDQLPYGTTHAPLAFCLYIAGIPFADERQPVTNTYYPQLLEKLGGEKGMPVEDSAEQCFAQGKPGLVEYNFRISPELSQATKAFNETQKTATASDISARAFYLATQQRHLGGRLSLTEALSSAACMTLKRWREELREWEAQRDYQIQRNANTAADTKACEEAHGVFLSGDFYRFAAVIMDARTAFLKLWQQFPPIIRLHRTGQVHSRNSGRGEVRTHPGFILYSTNAENETRRHLGAPTK